MSKYQPKLNHMDLIHAYIHTSGSYQFDFMHVLMIQVHTDQGALTPSRMAKTNLDIAGLRERVEKSRNEIQNPVSMFRDIHVDSICKYTNCVRVRTQKSY